MRRLPLESFTELARQLLEDPEVFLLIPGVASEKPDAQYICSQVASPRALDLTGRTTLKELLHLFDLAHVLVTNDSGPAHFAALTRIHVVVFFGPEIPERYRPLTTSADVVHTGYSCSPCIGPLQSAAVALQRQPVSQKHQRPGDCRARSSAPRGGAVCDRCDSLERFMTVQPIGRHT